MTTTALINPTISSEDQPKVDAIFAHVNEQLGFVPDGLKLYSISPPLLESFVGSVGYFMGHKTLSQQLLAMIRYLVSSTESCHFCIDFNAALLINKLGKTQDQLDATKKDLNNAPLESNEIILLKIALASIDAPEHITKDDMDKARKGGFSDRDLFDAVAVAANNRALTQILRTFKVEHQGTFQ